MVDSGIRPSSPAALLACLLTGWLAATAPPTRAAGAPVPDLDADSDRTGAIEGSLAEERSEDRLRVLVLNNCDDDDRDGRVDNADSVVNGVADRADLEPVVLRRLPASIKGRVRLRLRGGSGAGDPAVRVLDTDGSEVLGPTRGTEYDLGADERRRLAGSDLIYYVEGLQFAARAVLEVRLGGRVTDRLRLEVAPFLVMPHSRPALSNAVVRSLSRASERFVLSFKAACRRGGVDPVVARSLDVWMEDEMQWGYTRTPRQTLPVVLHMHRQRPLQVYVRSLLAPDVGYFQAFHYPSEKNSLDYGGNLEVTPPTTAFPHGRIYVGGRPSIDTPLDTYQRRRMHPRLQAFLRRQGVQSPVRLTTDWLAVGHVDEIATFLPDPSNDSFVLALASPRLALEALRRVPPETPLDRRYQLSFGVRTVGEMLRRIYLLRSFEDFNLDVDAKIFGTDRLNPDPSSAKGRLMAALDLDEDRVIELPVLFYNLDPLLWRAAALTPNLVNVSSMGERVLVADPFLPAFREVAEQAFRSLGLTAEWIDDWDEYHSRLGNVHCGTQELRQPFVTPWWEGAR